MMVTEAVNYLRRLGRHWPVLLLLAVALTVRVGVALAMNPFFGDQQEYLSGAHRLLDGQPLPILNNYAFVRQPGYSIFIAAVWLVAPARSFVSVRVAQAIVSTGTCLVLYLLARGLGGERRSALLAGWTAALYPFFLYQVAALGTECLFSFLLALGTYFFAFGFREDPVRWRSVAIGVFAYAAGMLVRPNLAPTEALLGLFLAWRYRHRWRTVVGAALVMTTGTLIVTLPWTIAVARQGLGNVFLSDGGGAWYYAGHRDFAVRIYCDHVVGSSEEMDPVLFVARTLPRSEQVAIYWRSALRWDSAHAADQLCLATGKLWNYWRPWVEPHAFSHALFAMSLASLPVLVLGLAGLWRLRSADRGLALVVAGNVVGGTLTAVAYSTQVRYRIPVVDLLLVPYAASYSAALFSRGMERLKARSAQAA